MNRQLHWCAWIVLTLGCQDTNSPKDADLNADVPTSDDGGDGTTNGGDDAGEDGGDGGDGGDSGDAGDDAGGADDGSGSTGGSPGTEPVEYTGFEPCRSADGHATTIEAVAETSDGMLMVDVAYSGGCETHSFELCWPDQAFMESVPVQVSLELLHTGPEDYCEAWIMETIDLDLSPMADAWREAYGDGSGEMIINLGGFSTLYSF